MTKHLAPPGTFLTVRAERYGHDVILKVMERGDEVLNLVLTPKESHRIASELKAAASSAMALAAGFAGSA